MLANLVDNARSFIPPESGRIGISLAKEGRWAVIHVIDNGPGIDADDLDRVFERFYTDRPSSEAFGQNSGLGLSITRQIIEAHDGTIKAGNVAGQNPGERGGAIFTVRLPLLRY